MLVGSSPGHLKSGHEISGVWILNAHLIFQAFYEIILLWGAIAAATFSFHGVSPLASYLMLPYQAWVTVASALSYSIWQNNKEKDE